MTTGPPDEKQRGSSRGENIEGWGPLAQFTRHINLKCFCSLQHVVYIILKYGILK